MSETSLAGALAGVLLEALKERDAKIAALTERVGELEQRFAMVPSIKFAGPWRDGVGYVAGSAVVRGGSLYLAVRDAAPGECPGIYGGADDADEGEHAPTAWRLCAKRGKDGVVPRDIEGRIRRLEDLAR